MQIKVIVPLLKFLAHLGNTRTRDLVPLVQWGTTQLEVKQQAVHRVRQEHMLDRRVLLRVHLVRPVRQVPLVNQSVLLVRVVPTHSTIPATLVLLENIRLSPG